MLHETLNGVVDLYRFGSDDDPAPEEVDLFIEIPHGATHTSDFLSVAESLGGPLPEGLVDFFHVNTDVGAFEVSLRLAELLTSRAPHLTVEIYRCRIPRTFIDTNRRIDVSIEDYRAGGVTPGIPPWVSDPADRELLLGRYHAYHGFVEARLNGASPTSTLLLLHTYAPRTLDVKVDEDIVATLRREYEPERFEAWPLRPEIEAITTDLDGTSYAPQALLGALRRELEAAGRLLSESDTYPLHPSTIAYDRVQAHPGDALCLEIRRDLLADPFDPFVEMAISDEKVDAIATPIARALLSTRGFP